MSDESGREETTTGGAGRFLRGTIMERFLAREDGEGPSRMAMAFGGAAPLTVTLTDPVREITETMPFTDPGGGEVGRAITAYTTTIPGITQQITDTVTRITGT